MLQFHRKHPVLADGLGLALVVASWWLMLEYRALYIEPRAWGAACALTGGSVFALPLLCLPRIATLWMQMVYGWGALALFAGLLTWIRSPSAIPVAAVALGGIAIVNQNATWGAIGLCLGAWSWLRRDFRHGV